jgi:indole-3-glycerol phosphate synthase
MSDVLTTIVAGARQSAEARARVLPMAQLERMAAPMRPRGDVCRAALAEEGVRVIAECKRRSPSRGVLRERYDPAAIAAGYAAAGAAGISVLTEPSFFDGSLDHLRDVRAAVTTPLLRKDFVINEYQIMEARAAGADAVLLIVAALGNADLMRLRGFAADLGLMNLVEVHGGDELARAIDAGADTIGVNSRSLRTLDVDTAVFERLVAGIPDDTVAVAESGIRTPEDVIRLRRAGFDAFLIGERFMTDADPGASLGAFRRDALERGTTA